MVAEGPKNPTFRAMSGQGYDAQMAATRELLGAGVAVTAYELGVELGFSTSRAADILRELNEGGVVGREKDGRSWRYAMLRAVATKKTSRARSAANDSGPSPATTGGDRHGARVDGERRALGYGRLSPGERKDAAAEDGKAKVGVGIVDQRQKVDAWCTLRSVPLIDWITDIDKSGKTLRRKGMQEALERLDAGDAEVLVAARLDRLARSLIAFGELLERAEAGGWAIVVLDFDLDTSTPTGRLVANIMMAVAQWQRESIAENTRDALAVKKAQGQKLGRPRLLPDAVAERIRGEREAGATLQAIADALTADGVATAHGGVRWHKQTVAAVLAREEPVTPAE